jgi:hypothetical protein
LIFDEKTCLAVENTVKIRPCGEHCNSKWDQWTVFGPIFFIKKKTKKTFDAVVIFRWGRWWETGNFFMWSKTYYCILNYRQATECLSDYVVLIGWHCVYS